MRLCADCSTDFVSFKSSSKIVIVREKFLVQICKKYSHNSTYRAKIFSGEERNWHAESIHKCQMQSREEKHLSIDFVRLMIFL